MVLPRPSDKHWESRKLYADVDWWGGGSGMDQLNTPQKQHLGIFLKSWKQVRVPLFLYLHTQLHVLSPPFLSLVTTATVFGWAGSGGAPEPLLPTTGGLHVEPGSSWDSGSQVPSHCPVLPGILKSGTGAGESICFCHCCP